MAATKIDGTAIARKVREGLQAKIAEKKALNPRFQPSLKIIQGALPPGSLPPPPPLARIQFNIWFL